MKLYMKDVKNMTEKKREHETTNDRNEEYDRERKENTKRYETTYESGEEYDRERKENMKLHMIAMKSMTEKQKRI